MKKINVMIAGLSDKPDQGKVSSLVAKAIVAQADMELWHQALSENSNATMNMQGGPLIQLFPIPGHEFILEDCREKIDLIVDFTQPAAVNSNAEMYCKVGIPFVMGTTGGDRQKLRETIESSSIAAVVATNMASPVVMFQEMVKFAAANFPHALAGFELVVRESHQASKKDVSGTAVGMLNSFASLGILLRDEDIQTERRALIQEAVLGIPKQYLGGHGYHTYTLLSPDGTVKLEFTHNVLGRSVYVDGALKAIRFLAGIKNRDRKGCVFSMKDVLSQTPDS